GPRARPQSAPRKSRIAPVYCRLRFRLQSAAQPGDYSRLLRRPRAANRSAETSQRIAVKLMYPNHGKTGTVVLSATEGKTHADAHTDRAAESRSPDHQPRGGRPGADPHLRVRPVPFHAPGAPRAGSRRGRRERHVPWAQARRALPYLVDDRRYRGWLDH